MGGAHRKSLKRGNAPLKGQRLISAFGEGGRGLTPLPADPRPPPQFQPPAELQLCKALASLRARERSLLLGEARAVPAGAAIAVLRRWDQSERFVLLLNPHGTPLKPFHGQKPPPDPPLPPRLTLRLSTDPAVPTEREVALQELTLGAFEGVLLSFPYAP